MGRGAVLVRLNVRADCPEPLRYPSWAKLVHTGAADLGQRVAEVFG